MRRSTIHVRPLVALLGAAFCAGAALAANYTLTDTTVEWPSSNEAENVSGNRFTIVGDVTVVITRRRDAHGRLHGRRGQPNSHLGHACGARHGKDSHEGRYDAHRLRA